jgi:hypothetical protein
MISPMLGVNATTDSVSRFKKVAWRRTLGWMTEGLHTPKSGQSIPAQAGSQRKLARTIFDN